MDFLDKLSLAGLVPVIAINDAEDAVPLCRALSEGGLPVAEITFRTAAAEEAIRRVHEELPNVLLCAGTVLTTDQVDRAVKAGAAAIVSPGLNPEVVRYCISKNIPVCPGTANPSDIEVALGFGLKAVKVFPAEAIGGIKLIKSMAAPYGDMRFMPTGGVNENNMLDYLSFGKILCCGGSWMVPKDAVEAKDWARITELTRSAVNKMLGLELRHVGEGHGGRQAHGGPAGLAHPGRQRLHLLRRRIRDDEEALPGNERTYRHRDELYRPGQVASGAAGLRFRGRKHRQLQERQDDRHLSEGRDRGLRGAPAAEITIRERRPRPPRPVWPEARTRGRPEITIRIG